MKIGRDDDKQRAETRGGVINHSRDPLSLWLFLHVAIRHAPGCTADRIPSKRILVRKSSFSSSHLMHLIVSVVVPACGTYVQEHLNGSVEIPRVMSNCQVAKIGVTR